MSFTNALGESKSYAGELFSYDDNGPPLPNNVNFSVIQGSYIENSGDILWEKIEVDAADSEKNDPTYADIYRPGFKHICGTTFLLMATQANWNGTQSQQGSQQTVIDNTGGDTDPRCGVFKISRSTSTEAQDYVYRVWEINAPLGTTALYPVNSYSYNQSATQCNGANEVSANQNPCTANDSAIPQLSGVVRSAPLYYYPNSSWIPGNPINGWNFGAFINYPIPTTVTWEKIDSQGQHLANSVWDMVNSEAKQTISNIQDCQQQNCQDYQDKDPRSGYFKINSILADGFGTWNLMERQAPSGYELSTNAKQIILNLWNTNATYGQIINQKSEEKPKITFRKINTSGELLEGANFTISNPNMVCNITDNGQGICQNPQGQTIGVVEDTDKTPGSFNLILPETGVWQLEETAAPAGYNFANNHIWNSDVLKMNDIYDFGDLINYQQPSLHWTKTDIDQGTKLGGAVFTVKKGQITFQITDCISAPCPVGENLDVDPEPGSFIIEKIPDVGATYTVSESTPPVGYFTNTAQLSGVVTQQPMNELGTMTDQHLPQLVWTKVDKDNNSVNLPDSIWNITDDIKPLGALVHDCDHNNEWCVEKEISYVDLDPQVGEFRVILDDTNLNIHDFAEYQAPPGYNMPNPPPSGSLQFSAGGCAVGSSVTLTGNLAQYFPSSQVTVGPMCTVDLGQFTNKRITPTLAWVKTDSSGYPLPSSAWTISSPDLPDYQSGRFIEDYTSQINYECQGNTPGNTNLCDLDPRPGYFMITDFYSGSSAITMQAQEINSPENYTITKNLSNTFSTICTGGDNQCFFDGSSGITQDAKTLEQFFSNHPGYQSITNLRLPYLAWDKVCDETGQPLRDSQWSLTNDNQITYSVSDNNFVSSNLPDLDTALGSLMVILPHEGNWLLRETSAPVGYKKTPTVLNISVQAENMIYNISSGNLIPNPNINDDLFKYSCQGDFSKNQPGAIICGIPNSANSPTIKWNKTNLHNVNLAGSQWQLQLIGADSIGQTNRVYNITDYSSTTEPNNCVIDVIHSKLCDSDPRPGHFVVPNVPGGSYKLAESISPNGYQALDSNNLCAVNYSTGQDWCQTSPANKNFITVSNTPEDMPSQTGEFYTVRDDAGGNTRIENTPLPTIVAWEKDDDWHTPITNSIWQICRLSDWNASSKTCSAPLTITDNTGDSNYTGLDKNAAPGGFNVILEQNSYLLYETNAPTGFMQPSGPDPITFDTTNSQYTWLGVFTNTQYPIISWHKMSNSGTPDFSDDFDLSGAEFSLYVNPKICYNDPSQLCEGANAQGEPLNPDSTEIEITNIVDCVASSSAECQTQSSQSNQDLDPRAGYYSIRLPACAMASAQSACLQDGNYSYYWTIKETASATGYNLPQNPEIVSLKKIGKVDYLNPEISAQSNFNYGIILNEPKKPSLSFKKIRSDYSCSIPQYSEKLNCINNAGRWVNNLPLGGATFEIADKNNNGAVIQDNFGQENYSCTYQGDWLDKICDSDPRPGFFFISSLPREQRNWTIREFDAPIGFVIDITAKTFCSSADEIDPQCKINTIIDSPFINDPLLGQTEWLKTDVQGKALKGSVWTLTNSSLGVTRIFTVSDNYGQANYYSQCIDAKTVNDSDLDKGIQVCDYNEKAGEFKTINFCMDAWNIEEKQAPEGYQKLYNRLDTLALTLDNPIQTFNKGSGFVNVKKTPPSPPLPPSPTPPYVPDTGVDIFQLLGIFVGLMSISSLLQILKNRTKKTSKSMVLKN